MDLTLLSGVVRNRRLAGTVSSRPTEYFNTDGNQDQTTRFPNNPVAARIFHLFQRNNICRRFSLRVHKFSFQWDLVLHFAICIFSLLPFLFTGERLYSFVPITVWLFYHILFMIYPRQANLVIPGFGRLKHSFKATIEDFFSPKLLPVLSFSFLLVTLSLAVTGHRLGGPPLCFEPCGQCLAKWSNAIEIGTEKISSEPFRQGCGYANGKEMLAFYTMAQTSFLLFVVVVFAMSICLAWRLAEEEHEERSQAERSLKSVSPDAYELRQTLIKEYGSPASSIRPEGSATWIIFGIVAALTFTLLGWHHWYVLPPSNTATLLILLNLLTILMTTLILHLGFFGRILSLYKRNYLRVQCLTSFLINMKEQEIDYWWNCRNFVLNEDLSLEYDTGGLAVSMTFLMDVGLFVVLLRQIYQEGSHLAMLEPPGSYCAYACMYITCCLIKIFTLATNTYEEQHHHIMKLQQLSSNLALRSQLIFPGGGEYSPVGGLHSTLQQSATAQGLVVQQQWIETTHSYDYDNYDDGPIFIDTLDVESNAQSPGPKRKMVMMSPKGGGRNNKSSWRGIGIGAGNNSGTNLTPPETNNNNNSNNLSSLSLDFQTVVHQNLSSLASAYLPPPPPTTPGGGGGGGSNSGMIPFPREVHPSLANFYYPTTILNPPENEEEEEENEITNHAEADPLLGATNKSINSKAGGVQDEETGKRPLSIVNPLEINRWNSQSQDREEMNATSSLIKTFTTNANKSFLFPTSTTTAVAPSATAIIATTTDPSLSTPATTLSTNPSVHPLSIPKPLPVTRQQSGTMEHYRQTIAEIISQIRKYDPYPCILGIPVMPALFNGSKFYIFICFVLIGVRTMISAFRQF